MLIHTRDSIETLNLCPTLDNKQNNHSTPLAGTPRKDSWLQPRHPPPGAPLFARLKCEVQRKQTKGDDGGIHSSASCIETKLYKREEAGFA